MKVILLEKNRHLGNIGDLVNVKPGFGRNYLIPQKKATVATAINIARFEADRVEIERKAKEAMALAQTLADQLSGKTIKLAAKAGEEGRLFGSIGTSDLAQAIQDQLKLNVSRSEVKMPHGTIRQVGEYTFDIQLHSDIMVPVKVIVVAEI
jgi:large subunit ribosomal protein L9